MTPAWSIFLKADLLVSNARNVAKTNFIGSRVGRRMPVGAVIKSIPFLTLSFTSPTLNLLIGFSLFI